jgi:ABC-2 type transport system permease protein
MSAILRKELSGYFKGLWAYVYAAFMLMFCGIFTYFNNLRGAQPQFEYALDGASFVFLIIIPMLTMRVVAEERRQKTDQLLYSLPLSMGQVVLGKYLALLIVTALPVCVMAFYPLILAQYGPVSLPPAYASLLAFFLLSAALAAIGMFISSMTENQAAAAGLCFDAMIVLYFANSLANAIPSTAVASMVALFITVAVIGVIVWAVTKSGYAGLMTALVGEIAVVSVYNYARTALEGLFPTLIKQLSVFNRFYTFSAGVFDLTAVVYYLSLTGVFVFLTVQSLEKRRWIG